MRPLRTLSGRPEFLTDHCGVRVADPSGTIVGFINSADHSQVQPPSNLGGERLVYALPTNITGGDLSLRYRPPWAPDESVRIGMDFSNVLPPGVGINNGYLTIQTNAVPPVSAQGDFTALMSPINPAAFAGAVHGRAIYVEMAGGVNGTDYQLIWTIGDSDGNGYGRTTLLLCAQTS